MFKRAVGDESRLEYTVIGDPVNRAAKLQNQTKVERVRALTTAATLARAGEPRLCRAAGV